MAHRHKSGKRAKPKTVLRLPDLEQSKTAVLNYNGLSYSGAVMKLIPRSSDTSVPFMVVSGVSGDQNAPIMLNRESSRRFLSAIPAV